MQLLLTSSHFYTQKQSLCSVMGRIRAFVRTITVSCLPYFSVAPIKMLPQSWYLFCVQFCIPLHISSVLSMLSFSLRGTGHWWSWPEFSTGHPNFRNQFIPCKKTLSRLTFLSLFIGVTQIKSDVRVCLLAWYHQGLKVGSHNRRDFDCLGYLSEKNWLHHVPEH